MNMQEKETLSKIQLLNGEEWYEDEIKDKMLDDDFYFDYLNTTRVLSKSSINKLVPPKSPKAYYYGSGKKESDAALRAGSLFHLAILEPEKYNKLKFSSLKTRTSAGFKAEQQSINETLYTRGEREFNERLVTEFTINKRAMSCLSGAEFEIPLIGKIDDIPFRGKADIVTPDGRILDLKTCGNLDDFGRSAYDYGYDIQCYIYSKLMGANPKQFEFIVISKNTYDIGFFKVDKTFIEQGRARLESAIDVYKNIFWNKSDEQIRETLNELSFDNTLYSKTKYNSR